MLLKNNIIVVCLALTLLVSDLLAAESEKQTHRLMILGDSLSAGYGLKYSESFPAKLRAALERNGLKIDIINSSVSGDTTAGGLARLPWALKSEPDAVVIELGANDGLRGLDPASTKYNLENILLVLERHGINVLLTGMLAPPNLGKEYGIEFNQVYKNLAREFKVQYYPFFLQGVATEPSLNQSDGIHPNANGVDEIVKRILPMVLRLFK